jgi:ATP-binding cassette subfamily B protein
MLGFTLVAGIGRYLMRNILIGLSREVEREQRADLYAFLVRMPNAFFERSRTGDLMSRIGDDVNTVRMATGPGLMSLLQTASLLPMTLALMVHASPRLALAVLMPFSILALGFYFVGRASHRLQQRIQVVTSDLNTYSHETISGERVVQAFGLEDLRVEAFARLSRVQARLNVQQTILFGTYLPLSAFTAGLSALVLVAYGGALVLRGSLTLGDLTAFTGYLAALAWPIMSLGWAANLFQRGKAGQERIDAVLGTDCEPLPAEPEPGAAAPILGAAAPILGAAAPILGAAAPILGAAALAARGLVHRFESGRGLGPLDLDLPAGARLAVVGGIGSGKTILLQVLAGLRELQAGRLDLDGAPLGRDRLREHWAGIGWVPQEAFLFSVSLRENLAMGRPEATEADLWEVARVVCLDDLVRRLPEGLDTVVGERGVVLSGGERQRAALARALLRRPRLLLMDDALSAVDAETETRILDNLRGFLGGVTLVLATHRVFVAELCDQVLVMEDGRAIQRGTPQELAERPGHFARIRRLQSLEREILGDQAS